MLSFDKVGVDELGIDKQIDKMGIKKTGEDLHGIHSGVRQDLTRGKFKFNLYYGVLCLWLAVLVTYWSMPWEHFLGTESMHIASGTFCHIPNMWGLLVLIVHACLPSDPETASTDQHTESPAADGKYYLVPRPPLSAFVTCSMNSGRSWAWRRGNEATVSVHTYV